MSLKDYLKQQLAPTIRLFFGTINILAYIGSAYVISWAIKQAIPLRFAVARELILEITLLIAALIGAVKFVIQVLRTGGNKDEH